MRTRAILIFTILLGLVFCAPVGLAAPTPKACVSACEKNCCAEKVCCAHSMSAQPQPAPAPAPPQSNLDLGILGLGNFSVLYVRPPLARWLAPRETAQAHMLPPLAASCIRLI